MPEIKSDIAIYYDCIKAMDRRVGEIISDLMKEPKDVVDNTIIFLPRPETNPATCLIRSAVPTDVPPNLSTFIFNQSAKKLFLEKFPQNYAISLE